MATISLTIDGKSLQVEAGKTILEVAQANGLDIPSLCHDPRLRPFGACRMCLVEIQGARGPVTACTMKVADGMVINTRTDEIIALRKMALEFLLSEHHGDCIAPCQKACPANIDIQGFIALIARKQYTEAVSLIKQQMPFPASVGRVCPRFCEEECRRHVVDEPMAICHLKRYVADVDLDSLKPFLPAVKPASGKQVGIVGGGPAGLAAAYYLAQEGHSVSVYESMPQLGGMLRYGIPEYRLPKAALDKEIATITALCKEVKCGVKLGKDITLDRLQQQHDAVILALGAQACQIVETPGNDLEGVWGGLKFLGDFTLGEKIDLGNSVAVIGGGNTAIDAARTAIRMGAGSVTIYYRRSRQEMPASAEEIEGAEEEGVKFEYLVAPTRLNGNGRVSSMTLIRMALGEPDASGRRRPKAVAGSDFDVAADTVVWATGQALDPAGAEDVPVTKGCFQVDSAYRTPVEGVFAAGDCVTGPTTVVEACGVAHKTATAVDLYLKGLPVQLPKSSYNISRGDLDEIDPEEYKDRERAPRVEPTLLSGDARRSNWAEIDPGFCDEAALKEAERCLSCGCQDVFGCELRRLATEYDVEEKFGVSGYKHPISDDHPYVVRDSNKCVLCGSCVRICQEVQGASALGFVRRGVRTSVRPMLEMPLADTTCVSCGQCISACPTGALTARAPLAKPGPWVTTAVSSVCPECGIGCQLTLCTHEGRLTQVLSPVGNPVNDGNLCKKGRFIDHHLVARPRVVSPMVRKGGQLVATSWQEALSAAARGLLDTRTKNGASSLGVWVSPRWSNEEVGAVQKLSRVGLQTNSIDTTCPTGGEALRAMFGRNASTATYSDIGLSDVIFVYGTDLYEDYPISAIQVRKAVQAGARLVALGHARSHLDSLAVASVTLSPEEARAMLSRMANSTSNPDKCLSDFESLALKLLAGAQKPLVIVDLDRTSDEELHLLLALVAGSQRLLGLRLGGNAQGLLNAGIGAADGSLTYAQMVQKLKDGSLSGLIVAGEADLPESGSSFVVCVTPFLSETMHRSASVVFPGSTFAESNGSYTNCEGRTQQAAAAISPPSGVTNWDVIAKLASLLDCPLAPVE